MPLDEEAPDTACAPWRLTPVPGCPDVAPAMAGSWHRAPDGGLEPRDQATAQAAGLAWPAPSAQAASSDLSPSPAESENP